MSRRAKLLGWALLALVLYGAAAAVVYAVSLVALQQGTRIDLPWFGATQKSLYRNGHVKVSNWLGIPGCIQPDPDLIYVPSIGTCAFDDIEFKTTLSFTAEGRSTGPKPAGTGIAVIGDSHAMGWGVNDGETFAAQLQALSGRPVYNLGVASYGTARELIRLKKSGVLDKVDTVIVQYCNNDRSENLQFDTASKQALHDKVFGPRAAPVPPNRLAQLAEGYGYALAAPFRALSESLRRKNFEPHYAALMPVLDKHRDLLAGKRVIVFYANPYGQRYRNFPSGPDASMPNVEFVDLGLTPADHRKLDNHMTPVGHRKAAERLHAYLQTQPARQQD
ncbi:MAG: SGNH/GDSL hydrolase family protein [Pseudomonadota bacterium]